MSGAVTVMSADETVDAGATGTRTLVSAGAGVSAAVSVVLRPIAGSDPYAFDVFYTYDAAGRRTSVTHPDGTRVGYGYDPTTGRQFATLYLGIAAVVASPRQIFLNGNLQ